MVRHSALRLTDLIAPLSPESFLEQHWTTGRPYLSETGPDLAARFAAIEPLASAEALLARHPHDVRLLGPDSFRSTASPRAALDFLAAGYNLYITRVEESVPEAKRALDEVARDLGVAGWQVHIEAFAGRAGGVSSRHYDHDINFQIMLSGEKEWLLEENRNIRNPLASFHPTRDRRGEWTGMMEEAYADSTEIPRAFAAGAQLVRAVPGTALFLPRSYWHETRSLTDTWSVNIVIRSATVGRALGRALEIRLHREPAFRAYVNGVVHGGRTLGAGESARKLEAFEEMKRAAMTALEQMTMDEAALAMLSLVGQSYAWTPQAAGREVVEDRKGPALQVDDEDRDAIELDADTAPLARRLVALRGPFRWDHVRAMAGDDALAAYRLLTELVAAGLMEARP